MYMYTYFHTISYGGPKSQRGNFIMKKKQQQQEESFVSTRIQTIYQYTTNMLEGKYCYYLMNQLYGSHGVKSLHLPKSLENLLLLEKNINTLHILK